MLVLWSMTFGEFRSPSSINMHVFPFHQLLAIVLLLLVHPYIYMIGYAYNYIWIGYHHHWNGSCCTSNQPLKYIHVWIKHMFFCFFFSGSQPWVVTVFTFTHASGVIPPASNSSIQFYPAVLISTNRNLSTVCWQIMAIGYTPPLGSDIYIYIYYTNVIFSQGKLQLLFNH